MPRSALGTLRAAVRAGPGPAGEGAGPRAGPVAACTRPGCVGGGAEGGPCRHHRLPPRFRDGWKLWPCCGVATRSFDELLAAPGCAIAAAHLAPGAEDEAEADTAAAARSARPGAVPAPEGSAAAAGPCTPCGPPADAGGGAREGAGAPLTCANCRQTFWAEGNHGRACAHHAEPPQFRGGGKLWPCCGRWAADWEEFLALPGCVVGRHRAAPI